MGEWASEQINEWMPCCRNILSLAGSLGCPQAHSLILNSKRKEPGRWNTEFSRAEPGREDCLTWNMTAEVTDCSLLLWSPVSTDLSNTVLCVLTAHRKRGTPQPPQKTRSRLSWIFNIMSYILCLESNCCDSRVDVTQAEVTHQRVTISSHLWPCTPWFFPIPASSAFTHSILY